jgi:multidrug transporter EmrE-like cation transporter
VSALVLATVFAAGFGLLIRVAQGVGANLVAVGAANYLTAMVVNAALFLLGGGLPPRGTTVAIAVAGGASYAAAFFLVYWLTRQRGASITGAVMRISTVVPVACSLLAWGERLSGWQAAGAGLALVSLPLLTLRPAARRDGPRGGDGGAALLVGLFFLNGLCLLAPRAFRATEAAGEEASFLAVLFATAAAAMCTVWALTERRAGVSRAGGGGPKDPRAAHPLLLDLAPGIAIGVCNALQNRLMVAALERLPGTVVYPFSAAVGLVLTVAVARVAWRERFGRLGTAGIALAGVAVVLVNLGAR